MQPHLSLQIMAINQGVDITQLGLEMNNLPPGGFVVQGEPGNELSLIRYRPQKMVKLATLSGPDQLVDFTLEGVDLPERGPLVGSQV